MIVGSNLIVGRRGDAPRPVPIVIELHDAMGPQHVVVATPCYGRSVGVDYAASMLKLAAAARFAQVSCSTMLLPGESLVPRARNALAAMFMASGHSHLMFIDADGGFEAGDVFRLLRADKGVVCGIVPRKTAEPSFAVNWLAGPGRMSDVEPVSGALEIHSAGAAFMMIERAALETMAEKMPGLRCMGPSYLDEAAQRHHHAFFDTAVADGGYWSEDLVFCRRWRECGGKVWAIPTMRLRHHGYRLHEGMLADTMQL